MIFESATIREFERWKEVRQLVKDVPVRQTRVAELDDDVAVSSSDVKIGWPKASGLKTKGRNVMH